MTLFRNPIVWLSSHSHPHNGAHVCLFCIFERKLFVRYLSGKQKAKCTEKRWITSDEKHYAFFINTIYDIRGHFKFHILYLLQAAATEDGNEGKRFEWIQSDEIDLITEIKFRQAKTSSLKVKRQKWLCTQMLSFSLARSVNAWCSY